MLLAYLFSTPVELMPTMIRRTFAFFRERSFVYSAESYESIGVMAPQNLIAYMSDKAAQLLDADVLRKFFGYLNTVALDGNFDRKALSARCED